MDITQFIEQTRLIERSDQLDEITEIVNEWDDGKTDLTSLEAMIAIKKVIYG